MKVNSILLVLAVALLSGLAAVFVASRWLDSRAAQASLPQAAAESPVPVAKIVIAARDIEVGSRIAEENLAYAEWPKATIPRGAFTSFDKIKDRVAVTRLTAGQPVLGAELASENSGAGLVALLEPGKRAMSILVNEVVGVGGFVLPNTYVDIISVTKGTNNTRAQAETILERIKVLAIAQEMQSDETKPRLVKTVTLEVSPDEAEVLAQRVNDGPIHLVLRSPVETKTAQPIERKLTQKPLLASRAKKVAPPAPPPAASAPTVPPVAIAEASPAPPPKVIPVLESKVRPVEPPPFSVMIIRGSKPLETIQFKNIESEERM
jgi:pilus assembly protein CpaB